MQPEQTTQPPANNDEVPTVVPTAAPPAPRRRSGKRPPMTRVVRAVLAAVGVALIAIFSAAAYINPYGVEGGAKKMSTHTQLGLPPCNFAELTGKPCPSCGMTTSFALLVRGDVSNSLRANWVGTMICTIWALTMVWALGSALRGRMLLLPRHRGAGETIFTAITGLIVFLMLVRWGVLLIWD